MKISDVGSKHTIGSGSEIHADLHGSSIRAVDKAVSKPHGWVGSRDNVSGLYLYYACAHITMSEETGRDQNRHCPGLRTCAKGGRVRGIR